MNREMVSAVVMEMVGKYEEAVFFCDYYLMILINVFHALQDHRC